MSVHRDLLQVEDIAGSRLELGLDQLASGQAFVFRGLAIRLGADEVQVEVVSSWLPENVSEDSANSDFMAGQSQLDTLAKASSRYRELVAGKPTRLVLIDDYGNGSIALCECLDGQLEWCAEFPRGPAINRVKTDRAKPGRLREGRKASS